MEDKKQKIRETLENLGVYSTALEFQIEALATALQTLELARKEASELKSTTVKEVGRWGEKTVPHPVFRILRDAEASITKQLKALGMTTGSAGAPIDDDPMVKLMNQLSD